MVYSISFQSPNQLQFEGLQGCRNTFKVVYVLLKKAHFWLFTWGAIVLFCNCITWMTENFMIRDHKEEKTTKFSPKKLAHPLFYRISYFSETLFHLAFTTQIFFKKIEGEFLQSYTWPQILISDDPCWLNFPF